VGPLLSFIALIVAAIVVALCSSPIGYQAGFVLGSCGVVVLGYMISLILTALRVDGNLGASASSLAEVGWFRFWCLLCVRSTVAVCVYSCVCHNGCSCRGRTDHFCNRTSLRHCRVRVGVAFAQKDATDPGVCRAKNYFMFFGIPQLLFLFVFASELMMQRKLDALFPVASYYALVPAFLTLLILMVAMAAFFVFVGRRTRTAMRVPPGERPEDDRLI
jgi:hypothetical protein